MDTRVGDYLIGAHNKVIGHYRHLLEAGSLVPPERDRIQRGLARIEAELDAIVTGPSASRRLVQAQEPPPRMASAY